jgi:hypothetical protein
VTSKLVTLDTKLEKDTASAGLILEVSSAHQERRDFYYRAGLTRPVNHYKNICEKMTYLIKIFTNGIKIQFTLESEPINTTESLHQKVLDFLGKISKEQLEKLISHKQISNFSYITYEEVERDIIVPITSGQENRLGVTVEQVLS